MHTITAGTYDEALDRLHMTGPEFDGWMSNHGPMVVEALARRGAATAVHRWTDSYARRLEEMPRARFELHGAELADSLGDPTRLAEWIVWFEREVAERPWEDVLADWWPVLLPGIAAGATHGVIRVGHAVQSLRDEATAARVTELAHALGYWAARWQAVPLAPARGDADPDAVVMILPRVARQEGGIRDRLAQLAITDGWPERASALRHPESDADVPAALDAVVDAVVLAYPRIAVGNPTMLVHAATAPNAVARTLPTLPRELWRPSLDSAWTAAAAVLAAYRPAVAGPERSSGATAEEAWQSALSHGGEHVVKLADTALDVYDRTGDPRALAAITTAVALDA